jgi:hypothetical protein
MGETSTTTNCQPEPDDLIELILATLRRDARLNAVVRAGLGIVGLVAAVGALGYVLTHTAAMVAATRDEGPTLVVLLAQTWPAVLLVVISALTGVAAWVAHSRAQDELERATDWIGRLRREAEVAIPARGLTHVFEEKLANARRAYMLQLWLGRALFIVSLGLFATAAGNATAGGSAVVSGVFAGGSLAGVLLGTAKHVPRQIGEHLARVIQIQCAITACDRGLGMLETYAYQRLCESQRDDVDVLPALCEVSRQMEQIVCSAMVRIERYAQGAPAPAREEGADVIRLPNAA